MDKKFKYAINLTSYFSPKSTTMHVKYVRNDVSSVFEPFTFAVGHLQKLTYSAWFISNLSWRTYLQFVFL